MPVPVLMDLAKITTLAVVAIQTSLLRQKDPVIFADSEWVVEP
jgi:hypothetical protein